MQNIPCYKQIKQARLVRGLSQHEAAALLEVDEKTYQRWEAGKHFPNFAGRRALRDHFGISPDLIPPSGREKQVNEKPPHDEQATGSANYCDHLCQTCLDRQAGQDDPEKRRKTIFEEIARKCHVQFADIEPYIQSQEEVTSFATGGSGAIVLFLTPRHTVVRKIWSEQFLSTKWNPDGKGVMSPPSEKAKLQVAYLRNLPDEAKPYFPHIYDVREITIAPGKHTSTPVERHAFLCDQSYLPGIEVSTFIARYQPAPRIVAHLYREILRCLKERIHVHRKTRRESPTVETSYLSKIVKRLEMAQQTAPETFTPLLGSEFLWIDGKRYTNIGPLLDAFRYPDVQHVLEPPFHCLVMGDTNTENVKVTNPDVLLTAMQENRLDFTYEELGIRFLDPRGIGFASAGATVVDDYMYDSKLLHNSLGNYDMIHGEYFRIHAAREQGEPHIAIVQNEEHPFRESYRALEQYFPYIMEGWGMSDPLFFCDDPYWLVRFAFLMGTHFAAMPPFHLTKEDNGHVRDEYEPQKRAVAVYCEGIKWLNGALAMLTGEQKELYGVFMPSLPTRARGGC